MTKHLAKTINRDNENGYQKKINIALWVLVLALVVCAIINQQYLSYSSILLQFIVTIIFAGIAVFLLFKKTQEGLRFYQYWKESVVALKKVTWPNKKETMQTTGAVVIMVIVMGLMLWTVDSILIRLVAWLLKRGGI